MIKIGHRGAMGYAPENTLKSIEKAIQLGVDMIEFDVQQCKTGELVVIHDLTVNRTTNGDGTVANLTLKELKALDAGEGESIPTLKEVLELINKKVAVNIELKGKGTAHKVGELIAFYVKEKNWDRDQFLVSSFDHQELQLFKQGYPLNRIGVLIYHLPHDLAKIGVTLRGYSLNVSGHFLSKELVDDAHEKGLKLMVYTVNEPKDIDVCKAIGVDGIFSNYPDRL